MTVEAEDNIMEVAEMIGGANPHSGAFLGRL